MEQTLFTKIINREVPAEIVYETEHALAFLDIHPTNKGHTLVVPKVWSRNMLSIEKEPWSAVMETVRYLAPRIQKALNADGINIIANCEPAAGQIIFHTHVHIIPRFEGDGFQQWNGAPYESEKEMQQTAEDIRRTLE